ncbi:carbamoyltransferase HypF [Pleurocapsa sp. PCC 7319]|uniref:carbamoyltransferase HypF n=1 Tax=Pleurocapsa sp. PCC 7319 TaxID=118161 RepID=UPI00034556E4|nr:carbamoyltransferase HypF [Pleurocapsa sp. PCC 7319]
MTQFKSNNQQAKNLVAEEIRVRGTVQGVGFRPTVYRLAKECGVRGTIGNDGQGVLIKAIATQASIDTLVQRLQTESPSLAKITEIIRRPNLNINVDDFTDFVVVQSNKGNIHTEITSDAATCLTCQGEIFSPSSRWYRYPFINCTNCGPRLSIIKRLPYDRANTSMARFKMCPDCKKDYQDPNNRRFHAQPIACPSCGPHIWLEKVGEQREKGNKGDELGDEINRVTDLLQQGYIVAIKGLGGFHLACDATNEEVVHKLRQRKHRPHKPLALMARDVKLIEQYCLISEVEKELLKNSVAPIVLLQRKQAKTNNEIALGSELRSIATSVAPDQNTLGFMLPYTPLHHLILSGLDIPLVMTSGNLTSEPQCINNNEARTKLEEIADYFLFHNREIVNRIDDSIARIINLENSFRIQILRRARGYAPAPINLPVDFPHTPLILAMGSELKNTFCLLRDGQAIVSQHMGDLANKTALAAYRQTLNLYLNLLEHQPAAIAVDFHPEYLSTKLGKELAVVNSLPLYSIQHHHAHVAACMVENGVPFHTSPVLGIALDGLGYGEDGTFWGGEFLFADYRSFRRLGSFKPVPMIGGVQAIYQPWRSAYAHLRELLCTYKSIIPQSWGAQESIKGETSAQLRDLENKMQDLKYGNLEIFKFLQQKPCKVLDRMIEKEINSPLASSCGRLFDAVAAAIGICIESCSYEGQGAIALKALAEQAILSNSEKIEPYPFNIENRTLEGELYLPYIEPLLMWQALLEDLKCNTSHSVIAAKFHLGLAQAIASLVDHICTNNRDLEIKQVALTGGVFQNQILLNQVQVRLEAMNLAVLTHSQVPSNDGGLALGQAAIAAAQFAKN